MSGAENHQTAETVPSGKARRLANLTGGSRKGKPNKNTALLKDAILQAATKAGGKEGLVGYLQKQATESPAAFLTLLGKVLPMQVTGKDDGPIEIRVTRQIVGAQR